MYNLISKSDPQFESDEAAKNRGNHFAQEEILKIDSDGEVEFIDI